MKSNHYSKNANCINQKTNVKIMKHVILTGLLAPLQD